MIYTLVHIAMDIDLAYNIKYLPTCKPHTCIIFQISVEGNVFQVTVLTDKTSASMSKQSSSDTTVTVDFGGAIETSRVFIVPYSADNATDGLYNFTIQLIGCTPESKSKLKRL